MGYALVDVDVLAPFPAVRLRDDQDGIGLVVRRGGRPVGFALQPLPAGSVLDPPDVDALAGAASAEALVREAVLDELGRETRPCPHTFTVVVCTRDRAELLLRCLRSVVASVERSGLEPPDVLVVDNAPPDGSTRAAVAELPGVRYVVEPRAGLDFARNQALRSALGDVVAFLDDDVVVDAGWYAELVHVWAVHPDAGGATGQVLPYELETPAQVLFERYGGFRRPWVSARYHGRALPGNALFPYGAGMFGAGCNMSYRREAVLALGGFDEALDTGRPLPGGGDLDMFSRVLRAGHPLVYAPAYLVHHQHRRTVQELRHQLFTWGTGHMAYVEKTWRQEPRARWPLTRLVAWQLRRLLRQTGQSLLGRSDLPVALSAAELRGSLVGLTGAYARSVRRSEAVRRAAAPAPDAGTDAGTDAAA